jgi:dihydrofolate synthase/folylpolyglutamate synthase
VDQAAEHLAPLLNQLVNYERTRPDRRLWDLSTMRHLLQRPGAPPAPRPAVQVGGSKGKGTTCAFLAALTQAAGRTAGVYTSPHVTSLLERIQVGGCDIDLGTLERLLRALLAGPPGERAPTFFEAMTLAAAHWFAERRTDLAVYEVGLGGRFDATTALPVDAGIVTMIELEHTDVLGDTIAQIAGEKAPVIRAGGVGFTGASGDALAVIRAHAAAVGARLFVLGSDFGYGDERWSADGFRARLLLPGGAASAVFLPGAAGHEPPALALAAAAFAHLLPGVHLQLDPAPRPTLPCRFELFREVDGALLVLDGAHTEQSLAMVAAEVRRRWPGQRAAVLFASAAGKRWQQGLSGLLPVADTFVVTGITGTTTEDPTAIAAWLSSVGARCEVAADVEAGLAALRRRAGPRLVVGSFYLAGRVRELVLQQEAARPQPR